MFLFYILWLLVCPFITIFSPTKIIGKKYLKRTKKEPKKERLTDIFTTFDAHL